MSEKKYLKIESEVESDGYDGYYSPSLKITELSTDLVFDNVEALIEHNKRNGWVRESSEEFKKYLKTNGFRYTPATTITAREGAKIKKLFLDSGLEGKNPVFVGQAYYSSELMNKPIFNMPQWKELVAGKLKIYAEIEPESLMTKEELAKLEKDRIAYKERKIEQDKKKKEKKLQQAKKLIEKLEKNAHST